MSVLEVHAAQLEEIASTMGSLTYSLYVRHTELVIGCCSTDHPGIEIHTIVMYRAEVNSGPMKITRFVQMLSKSRGIYQRVGLELGLDPSYVNRVAHGARKSPIIEAALRREIDKMMLILSKGKTKKEEITS
jgi:hypothetical protein